MKRIEYLVFSLVLLMCLIFNYDCGKNDEKMNTYQYDKTKKEIPKKNYDTTSITKKDTKKEEKRDFILDELKQKKTIKKNRNYFGNYGIDNRRELSEINNGSIRALGNCVAAVIDRNLLEPIGNGYKMKRVLNYKKQCKL